MQEFNKEESTENVVKDLVLDALDDALVAIDHHLHCTFLNRAAKDLFFRRSGAQIGGDLKELLGPSMDDQALKTCLKVIKDGTPRTIGWRSEAGGEVCEFAVSCSPLGAEGHLLRLRRLQPAKTQDVNAESHELDVSLNKDQRRELEEERRIAREQFEHVFNHNADMLALHHPNGDYIHVSPAATSITGYRPDELVGTNFYDHLEESLLSSEGAHQLQCVIKGEKRDSVLEFPFQAKDGQVRWLLVTIRYITDEQDQIIQWITSSKDISTQKSIEEDISLLNQNLKTKVAQSTRDIEKLNLELQQQFYALDSVAMVSIVDKGGHIISINDRFIKKLGYTKKELIGKPHVALISEEHPLEEQEGQWMESADSEPSNRELKYVTKSGAEFWVSETVIPFKDLDGQIEKIVRVNFDISHLKRTEKELREKSTELSIINEDLNQLNEELKTFSYSVSHDLKAPLRAIQGFSANLKKRYSDQLDDNGRRWLDFIDGNAQRMNDLIVDILEYSRIGRRAIQREWIDLEKLVERQYRLLRTNYPENKIQFRPTSLPKVEADPVLLDVVVHNLLGNALKYASKKPVIKINMHYELIDDYHTISIEDNGVGFDMKFYDQIFGVFKRLHHHDDYEGNGVGLANVKRAIDKLDGRIYATSEPDQGSTFTFCIPVGKRNPINEPLSKVHA